MNLELVIGDEVYEVNEIVETQILAHQVRNPKMELLERFSQDQIIDFFLKLKERLMRF